MKFLATALMLALVPLAALSPVMADNLAPLAADCQRVSVTVRTDHGLGSGTLITRTVAGEKVHYCWTAGHVIQGAQRPDKTFPEVEVVKELWYRGHLTGSIRVKAEVLKFSPFEEQDLALLKIKGYVFKDDPNAEFLQSDEPVPIGTAIVHVGSMLGLQESFSDGTVSQVDRELEKGKMWDQCALTVFPGSSGGSIWLAESLNPDNRMRSDRGKYIGMLTMGPGDNGALGFFIPVRRMRKWAVQEGIGWALDKSLSPIP